MSMAGMKEAIATGARRSNSREDSLWTDNRKFDNKEGYLGDYLGIPTIEIESIKSMINNPEQKRKTWNSLKLIIQLMKHENKQ